MSNLVRYGVPREPSGVGVAGRTRLAGPTTTPLQQVTDTVSTAWDVKAQISDTAQTAWHVKAQITDTAATAWHVALSAYDLAVIADGPRAYLRVTGAAETDLGVGAHTITYPAGAPSTTTTPNGDPVADFNGTTQYAEIADAADLSVSTTGILTVQAWMRSDNLGPFQTFTGTGDYVNWIGKGDQDSPGNNEYLGRMYPIGYAPRPNRISGYCFNPTGGTGVGSYFEGGVSGTPHLNLGQWIMWTLVIDTTDGGSPGTTKIYRNGVLKDTDALTGITPANGDAPLRVGTSDLAAFFEGAIGKVAVYDYALSAAQQLAHFSAMYAGKPPVDDIARSAWDIDAQVTATAGTAWDIAGLGQVTDTQTTAWNVQARLTDTQDTSWHVRSALTDTAQTAWHIKAHTTDTANTAWNLLAQLTDTAQTSWNVRARLTDTAPSAWNVLERLTDSAGTAWNVLARLTDTANTAWHVQARLTDTANTAWDIVGAPGQVTDTQQTAWNIGARITDTQTSAWNILQRVTDSAQTAWHTRLAVTDTANTAWTIVGRVTDTAGTAWNVFSRITDTQGTAWHILVPVGDETATAWHILAQATDATDIAWNVEQVLQQPIRVYVLTGPTPAPFRGAGPTPAPHTSTGPQTAGQHSTGPDDAVTGATMDTPTLTAVGPAKE